MAEENRIGLDELIEKTKLTDEDIMIIQDEENTKKISFRNFRDSLIEDDELPSIHRMYSSQKLQDAIDSFQKKLDYDIGKVENDISNIKENYDSSEEINNKLEEFSKTVPELAEVDIIKKALESKRNIADFITCDDIESGSDEKKIQVRNLSNEVLSMMTGETPVSVPSVPEGGWVQEDIATGAINAAKLSKQYRFRGHYPDGDINLFTRDGLYLLGASVEGLPHYDENEEDQDRLLEVFNYGPDQYIIQKVYYCLDSDEGADVRPVYVRKSLLSRLNVAKFSAEYTITDKFKMTRNTIEDNFLDMGIVTEGSVYDLTEDGNYSVKKGVKNLPNNEYDFNVAVRKYDTRTEYTAKVVSYDKCEIYISNSYLLSSGSRATTPWYMTNTVTKSRFDGKRVHLFGDGVCFGMGSSDITTLAYPALLSSKYGVIINNHALGDATIGNYGDEYFSERSVIKQIENTQFNSGDYAIIFAGSEDYKSGVARIGNNTDKNDYYFKGAINICIEKILQKNSTVKILVVSPLFRARLDADDLRNSDETTINELYLRDYTNAMKEVCEFNHIPFLDLHSTSMINKYNHHVYLSDRLYPNDAGHEMIANKIFSALNYFY